MGRKPIPVELCGDFCYVIGADIVGGTIKAALADLMGKTIAYHEEPIILAEGANAVIGQLVSVLKRLINETKIPVDKIWVITIGTPGIFDPGAGRSRHTFFMDRWDEIDIQSWVRQSLSIETLIDNDVNLDVMGESWKGVGRDYDDILYVKLGQGLAARIVLNGSLLRGEHGMAGEIGYMMPGIQQDKGEVENYEHMLCNSAVSWQYRELTGNNTSHTISDLCSMANKGDKAARKIMDQLLDKFSIVLLNSAAILDPQVIILGGDACYFSDKEITLLKQKIVQHFPLEQNIITSRLHKQACLYGAVKVSLDHVEKRITDLW
jgi:predicted NBD/HSP70 family sugar kinase